MRKYNNAIRRAAKADPAHAVLLPDEVSYQTLKNTISTRRALYATVNRLERITRPGALDFVPGGDGAIHTRYEQREFAILKSVRERRKSMRRRALGIQDGDIGRQGIMEAENLHPSKTRARDLSTTGLRRFLRQQEALMMQSGVDQVKRMYQNYITALDTVFGGYPSADAKIEAVKDAIRWYIDNDPAALKDFFESGDEILTVGFVYSDVEREMRLDYIVERWRSL